MGKRKGDEEWVESLRHRLDLVEKELASCGHPNALREIRSLRGALGDMLGDRRQLIASFEKKQKTLEEEAVLRRQTLEELYHKYKGYKLKLAHALKKLEATEADAKTHNAAKPAEYELPAKRPRTDTGASAADLTTSSKPGPPLCHANLTCAEPCGLVSNHP